METILFCLGLTSQEMQAAALQGMLSFLGVVITGCIAIWTWRANRKAERTERLNLRTEKTRDLQSAIRAEIRGQWYELRQSGEISDFRKKLLERLERETVEAPFVPLIPRLAQSVILEAIVADIALLDHGTIREVMLFYRQLAILNAFIDELKSEQFAKLPRDRRANMLETYFTMLTRLQKACVTANRRLEEVLKLDGEDRDLNMPDPGRTDPLPEQDEPGVGHSSRQHDD